jgi:hypothetical protein
MEPSAVRQTAVTAARFALGAEAREGLRVPALLDAGDGAQLGRAARAARYIRALKMFQPVPTRSRASQPPEPLPGYIHR